LKDKKGKGPSGGGGKCVKGEGGPALDLRKGPTV